MPALSFSVPSFPSSIVGYSAIIKWHTMRMFSPKRYRQFQNNPTIQMYYKQRTKNGYKFAEATHLRTDGLRFILSDEGTSIEEVEIYTLYDLNPSKKSNRLQETIPNPSYCGNGENVLIYSSPIQLTEFPEMNVLSLISLDTEPKLDQLARNDGFNSFSEMNDMFMNTYSPEQLSHGFMLIQWEPDSVIRLKQTRLTKIVVKPCQDCGAEVQILVNDTADIVAVRCPDCFKKFNEKISHNN